MNDTVLSFLNWQFFLFGSGIAAIVYMFRIVAEYIMFNYNFAHKESKLWNDLILPILPAALGCTIAMLFKTYPYPYINGQTTSSFRFMFGLVTGLSSGLIYRIFKSIMNQMAQKISGTTESSDNLVDPEPLAEKMRESINKE